MGKEFSRIIKKIDGYKPEMINTMSKMIAIKSVSPLSGGTGEKKRAEFLKKVLEGWGLHTKIYSYKDSTKTDRSNVIGVFGDKKRTLWIMPHIDTVSEGDIKLWKTNPYQAKVIGGKVYGRGTSDNGQDVISAMFALKALKEARANIKYNYGIALVADEELGSEYGVKKLIKESIFKQNDMYLVPDSGNSKGDEIEIAEKGALWLKITVHGKQVHASIPHMGKNAFRYSVKFLEKVDAYLHKKYTKRNKLFKIAPGSTFEMTKHEKNVDSVNIIPGTEVFYIDCRVLPEYSLDSVLSDVQRIAKGKDFKGVKISIDVFNRADSAKPTSPKSEISKLLKKSILSVNGTKAKFVGIGGGTVAAFFRYKGWPAVVWAKIEEVAHSPNEYAHIDDMLTDAKVFAKLFVD